MANNNTMMMVVMMMMVLGIGGFFLLSKKKTTELQVGSDGNVVIPATMGQYYEPRPFDPSGPIFLSDGSVNLGVPITGGSKYNRGTSKFAWNALGTCQCDNNKCCYKSTYQPRKGGTKEETECRSVYYGDKVDACERAVQAFNDEVFSNRVSQTPTVRRAMNARLANIFST